MIVTKFFIAASIYSFTRTTAVLGKEVMERSIAKLETARQKREGGGFLVRRPVGDKINFSACDPFLMLDHMGPSDYGPGEAVGAPDHPHRGFETVTYIIEGSMTHKDSVGNSGNLLPGWVQWMTAGSGVVHSEMPSEELLKNGGRLEGFQLWVNLPKKDKMIKPRYQDTAAEKIPVVKSKDGKTTVKVIAGESLETKAVIETKSPILYLDIQVSPGGSFTQKVPSDFNCFIYTWRGSGFIGDTPVKMGQVALLSKNGDQVTVKGATEETVHVLLIGGVPINDGKWGVPMALIDRYSLELQSTMTDVTKEIDHIRIEKLNHVKKKATPCDLSKLRFAPDVVGKLSSLVDWLTSLGLPMYIDNLLDEGYDDMHTIPYLSQEHLQYAKITKPEHINRLIRSIENMAPDTASYNGD